MNYVFKRFFRQSIREMALKNILNYSFLVKGEKDAKKRGVITEITFSHSWSHPVSENNTELLMKFNREKEEKVSFASLSLERSTVNEENGLQTLFLPLLFSFETPKRTVV